MLTAIRKYIAVFGRANGGVAIVEFAFVAPVMLVLALGGVDVARYVIATEKVTKVANTIAQMISVNNMPSTTNPLYGAVNYIDLQFYHDSAMVIFPDMLADAAQQNISWTKDISITMSSVNFTTVQTNCGATCTYTPAVVWTGGDNPRPCSPALIQAVDASIPSPTTLPADVFGPGSVIVVDVQYNFHPFFGTYIPAPIGIARSVYLAPRYKPQIIYQVITGDNGIVKSCP
jgi:TadE-like protein